MPRQARKESKTGYYHILVTGLNNEEIFIKDKYKTQFMNLIKNKQDSGELSICCYAVLSNHIHLIVNAKLKQLSLIMKSVCTSYASYYNNCKNRSGMVFNDRFKSTPIETDDELINNICYIHNNAVENDIVDDFTQYQWGSGYEYFNKLSFINEDEKELVLEYFSGSVDDFRAHHSKPYTEKYLETTYDKKLRDKILAKQKLNTYLNERGVNCLDSLFKDSFVLHELCYKLYYINKFKLGSIASLLNITEKQVSQSARNYQYYNKGSQ